METIVFEDSPLAHFLEGQGSSDDHWPAPNAAPEAASPLHKASFAPSTSSLKHFRTRKPPPTPLSLDVVTPKRAAARVHERCSSIVHHSFGWSKNANFLEQFRYIIVASQLLNEHSNRSSYQRLALPKPSLREGATNQDRDAGFVATRRGLSSTAIIAFGSAYLVRWFRLQILPDAPWAGSLALLMSFAFVFAASYLFLERQWQQNVQRRAIESATRLTSSIHDFDAAVTSSMTMIQEVELLSRGYNISPMPPISRIAGSSEPSRCARLRRTLRRTLDFVSKPFSEAYRELQVHAVQIDLEKYHEIYEISRMDIEDAENVTPRQSCESEAPEALLELKLGFHSLQTLRKLLLCTLLALDFEQGKPNASKWSAATKTMDDLTSLTTEAVIQISEANENEEAFPAPPTPQGPLTPNRELAKGNMKQLSTLSEGIRSLHAKMRLLREEAEKTFSKPDVVESSTDTLLHQYDSVGLDLKDLVQDWERGKVALASTWNRRSRPMSPSKNRLSVPLSPSSSLGGSTAVEGSPQDALLALKGIPRSSSRSSAASNTSDEQLFEAVAAPRLRSAINRNERIARINEDRRKHAEESEKVQATTHMLKELETVIKLRPRGRTTGRISSV